MFEVIVAQEDIDNARMIADSFFMVSKLLKKWR